MNELALRPRSPTELVDAAFQVFRRDPAQFIVATAAVYVPWLVVRLVLDLGVSTDLPTGRNAMWALLAALIVYAIVGGVVAVVASDVYLGQPADAVRALRVAFARILTLFATGIITLFAIFVAALFFLFPALYPLAAFFAVRQAVVLEGGGTIAAIERSSHLSKDVKRHVLNTLLLILLLTGAVSFGIGLLAELIPSRVVMNVVVTAAHVVLYPFFGITETLLYYDIRIRKEGFDVEYLATTTPMIGAEQPGTPL
jgi:hypothetical protein